MVELQCDLKKTVSTAAALSEHLQEFDALWDWWDTQWLAELSESEREKFEALWTDSNDRQAFRIIRNFARRVQEPGKRFQNCRESTLRSPRRRFCNFCESRWIANIRAIGFAA